jgi:hypothetical protein
LTNIAVEDHGLAERQLTNIAVEDLGQVEVPGID